MASKSLGATMTHFWDIIKKAMFTKRGNGQWQAKVRRKGHPPQSRTFDLKVHAEECARGIERDMDNGEFRDRRNAQNTTLYDVLQRYLERDVPKLKSLESVKFRIEAFKSHMMARYSIAALTPTVIQDWIDDRLSAGVSGSTVNRELTVLRTAINKGILSLELNINNPVFGTHRPKEAPPRERRRSMGRKGGFLPH